MIEVEEFLDSTIEREIAFLQRVLAAPEAEWSPDEGQQLRNLTSTLEGKKKALLDFSQGHMSEAQRHAIQI